MAEKEKKLTYSTVKGMGFSDKLIRELLPEPELVDNPHYKCAAPMRLYFEADVLKAMQEEPFIAYQVKRRKRTESAKKAVKTKCENLKREMLTISDKIIVKRLDLQTLAQKTIKAKNDYYEYLGLWRNIYRTTYGADAQTLDRWMVNYIRHNLTEYDEELDRLYGKTGRTEAYFLFFKAVMEKIATVYPELKEECENQIRDKEIYCTYSA